MENLLKILDSLTNRLRTLVVQKNAPTLAGQKLYETARQFLGQDASPKDRARDEYGCAESLNAIAEVAWGEPVGGDLSTYRMYIVLKNHRKFVEVTQPIPGDIIISPTGFGGKNGITNGHVGVISTDNKVMSNNSKTGKFEENFTLFSWKYRYKTLGGYPVYFFRRVVP